MTNGMKKLYETIDLGMRNKCKLICSPLLNDT